MNPSPNTARIGFLLALAIAITIGVSYIPHEFSLVRLILSGVLFAIMAMIMILALRSVLREL